ncbi:hypothetical protein O6H91_Y001900 [Diphasiastrum complanatum]|nr:hypothetical protein O6H91_Y001900 [Diphasiastrum complanatum]
MAGDQEAKRSGVKKRKGARDKGDALPVSTRPRRSKRLPSKNELVRSDDSTLSMQNQPMPLASRPPATSELVASTWHCNFQSILTQSISQQISLLIVIMVLGLWLGFQDWKSQDVGLPKVPASIRTEEVDNFFKKSTKWMQSQIDIAEVKVGREVAGLKRKFDEKIDETASFLETQLLSIRTNVDGIEKSMANVEKKLEKKVASLETKLQGLKTEVNKIDTSLTNDGFVTRSQVGQLVKSVVDQRAEEGIGKALDLEDAKIVARNVVMEALEKHVADGIGRADYALKSGGAKVVDHSESYTDSSSDWKSFFWINLLTPLNPLVHPKADKILEPSFGEPGQCFALKGTEVFVDIALRNAIYPEAVTLEHVSKLAAYDMSTAPKHVQIYGWIETFPLVTNSVMKDKMILLADFTYDISKNSLQTFDVVKNAGQKTFFNRLKLQVNSNHGHPKLTCLYRLRVHGTENLSSHSDSSLVLPSS